MGKKEKEIQRVRRREILQFFRMRKLAGNALNVRQTKSLWLRNRWTLAMLGSLVRPNAGPWQS